MLRSLIRGGQLPRLGGFSAEGDCLGSWWTWIDTARREDCCTHPGGSRAWPPEGFRRSLCGGSQERTRTWGPEPFEGLNISFGNWPLSHVGSRTGFGVARDRRDRLGISTAWRYVVWLCTGWGRSHSAASGAPGNECRRGMMGGMRPLADGWRWVILLGVSRGAMRCPRCGGLGVVFGALDGHGDPGEPCHGRVNGKIVADCEAGNREHARRLKEAQDYIRGHEGWPEGGAR